MPTVQRPEFSDDHVLSSDGADDDKPAAFHQAVAEQRPHGRGTKPPQAGGRPASEAADIVETLTFPSQVVYSKAYRDFNTPQPGSRLLRWLKHMLMRSSQAAMHVPTDPDDSNIEERLEKFLGRTAEQVEEKLEKETPIPQRDSLEERLQKFLGVTDEGMQDLEKRLEKEQPLTLTDKALQERLEKLKEGVSRSDDLKGRFERLKRGSPQKDDLEGRLEQLKRAPREDSVEERFEKLKRDGAPTGAASPEAESTSPLQADPGVERSGERVAQRQAYDSSGRAVDYQP